MKKEVTANNIIAYIIGNLRYKLYYSKYFNWLMRTHIHEQIHYRIKFMEQECFDNGSCKICGCETTALQMANKACDKPCYPPMMGERKWIKFAAGQEVKVKGDIWKVKTTTTTFKNVKEYVDKNYYIYKNGKLVHNKKTREENDLGK
jgi:hypothetical protein